MPIVLLGSFYIWSYKWNCSKLWIYSGFDLTDITLDYYIEILNNPTFFDSLKTSLQISIISSIWQ